MLHLSKKFKMELMHYNLCTYEISVWQWVQCDLQRINYVVYSLHERIIRGGITPQKYGNLLTGRCCKLLITERLLQSGNARQMKKYK